MSPTSGEITDVSDTALMC